MNYPPQAIAGITQYGYTLREAQFLYVTAVHSGHFVRRQFNRFTAIKDGAATSNLIARLLGKNHAREYEHAASSHGRGGTTLRRYHLFSKPFYRNIGKENCNNRRADASLTLINERLAGLDFVIDYHQEIDFFEDIEDRVRFFTDLGISPSLFPAKVYASPHGHEPSTCHFVDKFPMGVDHEGRIHFTYCDEQVLGMTDFETHVRQYLPLLRALERPWRMTFITTAYEARVDQAERVFGRFFRLSENGLEPELERYFQLKTWFLEEQWMRFSQQDSLDRAAYERIYETPQHKAMYEQWTNGTLKVHRPAQPSALTREFNVYIPASLPETLPIPTSHQEERAS